MTNAPPYSAGKAARYPLQVVRLASGVPFLPTHVIVSPADVCNQSCAFCCFRQEGQRNTELFGGANPNRFLPPDVFWDIISCEPFAVTLTGGGEPTAHPNFADFCLGAASAGVALGVITNGVLASDGKNLAGAAKADWVRVSVDAPDRKAYAELRRCPEWHWDAAWAAVEALAAEDDGPEVGVGYVVTKDNWHDMLSVVSEACRRGADHVRLSAVLTPDGPSYYDGWCEQASDSCRDLVRRHENGETKVYDLFTPRVEAYASARPYSYCYYQHFAPFVGADLNVYRCCNTAFTGAGLLGSLADKSFSDLWLSDEVQINLRGFDPSGCHNCQHDDKNLLLGAMVDGPSGHDLFL